MMAIQMHRDRTYLKCRLCAMQSQQQYSFVSSNSMYSKHTQNVTIFSEFFIFFKKYTRKCKQEVKPRILEGDMQRKEIHLHFFVHNTNTSFLSIYLHLLLFFLFFSLIQQPVMLMLSTETIYFHEFFVSSGKKVPSRLSSEAYLCV